MPLDDTNRLLEDLKTAAEKWAEMKTESMSVDCHDFLDGTLVPKFANVRIICEEGEFVSVLYEGQVRVLVKSDMKGCHPHGLRGGKRYKLSKSGRTEEEV